MKKTELAVKKAESIGHELSQHFEKIRKRAYELFQRRGASNGSELDDWFNAERELSIEPAIELRRADGRFEIDAELPDVGPEDLSVQVTDEDVLIQARVARSESTKTSKSETLTELFRAVHLPLPINPEAVKADYKNGHLRLTAPIAESAMGEGARV